MFRLVLFLCFVLINQFSWAQNIDLRSVEQWPLALSPQSFYYIDESDTLSIAGITSLPDSSWKPQLKVRPVFGFTNKAIWYKTNFIQSDSIAQTYRLQVGNSQLFDVKVYQVKPSNEIRLTQLGARVLLSEREVWSEKNIVSITFEPGKHHIYSRIKSNGIVALEYALHQSEQFFVDELESNTYYSLLIGVLLFSILYCIVIYVVVKEISYLYFVLMQFFYLIVVLQLTGLGQEHIWPNWIGYSTQIHRMGMYLSSCFSLLFTMRFLETKSLPKIHVSLKFFFGFSVVGIISIFGGFYQAFSGPVTYTFFITVVVNLAAAILRYREGYKPARFYILARTLIMATLVLNFLTSLGMIPYIELVVRSHFIAGGLEAILLSFALADRIKSITYEAEKAKNNQLREQLRAEEAEFRAKTAELQVHAAEIQARAIETENERKSEELEKARTMQVSMLPKMPPFIEHYDISMYLKTATEVGGDYYDFFPQSKGDMIVAIGDASGHGLVAGLMVTITKTALSFMQADSLHHLMNQLNKGIYQIRPNRMNMAMRLMHISNDVVSMSTAAMPDLIYYKDETQESVLISQPGLPLGSFSTSTYETIVLPKIKTGDVFVMVSDGVVEHRNSAGEEYGYDRICSLMRDVAHKTADEIIDALLNDLNTFTSIDVVEDDLTYLVIKRT